MREAAVTIICNALAVAHEKSRYDNLCLRGFFGSESQKRMHSIQWLEQLRSGK